MRSRSRPIYNQCLQASWTAMRDLGSHIIENIAAATLDGVLAEQGPALRLVIDWLGDTIFSRLDQDLMALINVWLSIVMVTSSASVSVGNINPSLGKLFGIWSDSNQL